MMKSRVMTKELPTEPCVPFWIFFTKWFEKPKSNIQWEEAFPWP
jgi:hypothetical protein